MTKVSWHKPERFRQLLVNQRWVDWKPRGCRGWWAEVQYLSKTKMVEDTNFSHHSNWLSVSSGGPCSWFNGRGIQAGLNGSGQASQEAMSSCTFLADLTRSSILDSAAESDLRFYLPCCIYSPSNACAFMTLYTSFSSSFANTAPQTLRRPLAW